MGNVIGFQGILNYKLTEKGAGLVGTEVEPLISSEDRNFRPSDIEVGADGASDAEASPGEVGAGDPVADAAPADVRGKAAQDAGVARAFRGHRLLRRRRH